MKRKIVKNLEGRIGVESEKGMILGRVKGGIEKEMYGNEEID